MPYAFEHDETLSAALPRLMLEQIERAAAHLTSTEETPEKRVHNARKRIKETRAILRMIRVPLGKQFAIENRWYRDAARDLASARDAQAVIEALEKLDVAARVKRRVQKTLEQRKNAIAPAGLQGRIDNTIIQLDAARNRIAAWPELGDDFETIGHGLEQIYRDGRTALTLARGERTPENLHEWRKRVKDHWYHLQLLRPLWPDVLKASSQALATLSEHLGDHHDLHVLEGIVEGEPLLTEAITARLAELEEAAFTLGARVYAEKPAAWRARMRAYWDVWRRNARLTHG
ncbi:MAG TPA: CHAD domain-containing protein [Thermoanaerobaculia bacterium]|jgi:CHAD domain-containing protein